MTPADLIERLSGFDKSQTLYIDADEIVLGVYVTGDKLDHFGGDRHLKTIGEFIDWLSSTKAEQVVVHGSVNWHHIDEIEAYKDGVKVEFF